MSKYFVRIVNDELPAPRYVERGLGIGGVKITDDPAAAKRYGTREEAEKIAAIAIAQKDKEPEGEQSAVEIVEEDFGDSDGWETRFRFEQTSTGAETVFQMKKTPSGVISRYRTFDGTLSPERPASEMQKCFIAWTDCVRAWATAKIGNNKEGRR